MQSLKKKYYSKTNCFALLVTFFSTLHCDLIVCQHYSASMTIGSASSPSFTCCPTLHLACLKFRCLKVGRFAQYELYRLMILVQASGFLLSSNCGFSLVFKTFWLFTCCPSMWFLLENLPISDVCVNPFNLFCVGLKYLINVSAMRQWRKSLILW